MLDAIGLNRSVSRSRREPPQCDSHRSVASLKFREPDDLISEFDLEAHCDRDRFGVVKEYFGKRKIDTWRNYKAISLIDGLSKCQDARFVEILQRFLSLKPFEHEEGMDPECPQ